MTSPKTNRGRILVVDDDRGALDALAKLLEAEGFVVSTAEDGVAALEAARDTSPDVVITDVNMPRMDGMALLGSLHAIDSYLPVIVMTSMVDLGAAVRAMKVGAEDYLPKPIDVDALLVVIERALERRGVKAEAENLRRQLHPEAERLAGLVGASSAMQRVYSVARQVAGSRATVLVTGESGTGKGEIARAIHALGPRAQKPFVSLHCAALPETLLESELFGFERGAFTGADKRRIGRFEQANGGTLFLDEIGEIPPLMQVKLLRVLQERTVERLGSNEPIALDVRVIAATNRDLAADVAADRFREDLYYRLNVVHLEMPPLRLRGDDILTLAEHFVRKIARDGGSDVEGFTAHAKEKLLAHRWPGNVRELENTIERAMVLTEGRLIDAHDLPLEPARDASMAGLRIPGATMAELEKHAILKTLDACGGSTARAAEMLGISIRTIQYRLHQYGVARLRPTASSQP